MVAPGVEAGPGVWVVVAVPAPGVIVGDGVPVAPGEVVAVGVSVAGLVAVAVGVFVGVGMGVLVAVGVDVFVGVFVGVLVGESVGSSRSTDGIPLCCCAAHAGKPGTVSAKRRSASARESASRSRWYLGCWWFMLLVSTSQAIDTIEPRLYNERVGVG